MQVDELGRKIRLGWLLDFYGGFLTERQRIFFELHHNQDLSLVEIAEQEGISRQGVHDAIRRGEATLLEMENRLGLLERFEAATAALETLSHEIGDWTPQSKQDEEQKQRWQALAAAAIEAWRDDDPPQETR